MAASTMPLTKHMSQEGKNDPRMLNVGACLQPASALVNRAAWIGRRRRERFFTVLLPLRDSELWTRTPVLGLYQLAGLKGEVCGLQQQLRPS